MTSFHDVRFPTGISRRASGGPERRTDVVALASGHEERNSRWAHSRRRYNAGYGIRTLDEIHDVIGFFEERRGRLHGFRWKDHADYKSGPPQSAIDPTDQEIGTGDGTTASFQLIKSYGDGGNAYVRPITKPVAGTVRVAVDGTEVGFTPDALTGMEASLRFAGPETLETKIFGRLSAWQNWIFQRPNSVGEQGALKLYGSGVQPNFDRERV